MMERRLTDIKGLAAYLGLPVSTIYSWRCRGRIPEKWIVRIGTRMLRIDLTEVDKSISAAKAEGGSLIV